MLVSDTCSLVRAALESDLCVQVGIAALKCKGGSSQLDIMEDLARE